MEKPFILPMYTSEEPHLHVSYTGQLVFIQNQYLIDIEGIAEVMMMGGLIYSPKTQEQRDMYNYFLN
jgi:hypothetical protein